MPKYIVVTALGEEHPCLFGDIRDLIFCKDQEEVQAALPHRLDVEEGDVDWAIYEIVPGSNKPRQCSIIFKTDGRTIKSISSNGIHPGDLPSSAV